MYLYKRIYIKSKHDVFYIEIRRDIIYINCLYKF